MKTLYPYLTQGKLQELVTMCTFFQIPFRLGWRSCRVGSSRCRSPKPVASASQLTRDELHWSPVKRRIKLKDYIRQAFDELTDRRLFRIHLETFAPSGRRSSCYNFTANQYLPRTYSCVSSRLTVTYVAYSNRFEANIHEFLTH